MKLLWVESIFVPEIYFDSKKEFFYATLSELLVSISTVCFLYICIICLH